MDGPKTSRPALGMAALHTLGIPHITGKSLHRKYGLPWVLPDLLFQKECALLRRFRQMGAILLRVNSIFFFDCLPRSVAMTICHGYPPGQLHHGHDSCAKPPGTAGGLRLPEPVLLTNGVVAGTCRYFPKHGLLGSIHCRDSTIDFRAPSTP